MNTKTIRFEVADGGHNLLLVYSPQYGVDSICARLGVSWDDEGNLIRYTQRNLPQELRDLRSTSWTDFSIAVKHVYHFEQADLVDDQGLEEEFAFLFASAEERGGFRYWRVSGRILGIPQDVFLCVDRYLKHGMFAAGYGGQTSVFKKISDITASDEPEIIVGGGAVGAIPWDDFDGLLSCFPTTALLRHYGDQEIAGAIGYYLKPRKDYAKVYENSKRRLASKAPYEVERMGTSSIRENFDKSLLESIELVERQLALGEGGSEATWQKILLDIMPALYPQYIAVVREAVVPEIISKNGKKTNRRIDHLLIDASGNVDILEVKRAFPKEKVIRGPYRDNYVPGSELAGGIEQAEKYLHYLSHLGSEGEIAFTKQCREKLRKQNGRDLPEGFTLRCVSPHALLFIGHCEFSDAEQRDFDLIRRQYTHVVDVITYDDLLLRLKRMEETLTG